MARADVVNSQVLFHPVALCLNSNAHRASLDGNQVSMASGVDQTAEGIVRRMPGGKRVTSIGQLANYNGTAWVPHRAKAVSFQGLSNGYLNTTQTTADGTGTSGTITATVTYSGGFNLYETICIYKSHASTGFCGIYQIVAIPTPTTLTLTSLGETSTTGSDIKSGATVVTCQSFGDITVAGAASTFTLVSRPYTAGAPDPSTSWIAWGIAAGMPVKIMTVTTSGKTDATAEILTHTITVASATVRNSTITLTANYTPLGSGTETLVLIPSQTALNHEGVVWSSAQGGVGYLIDGTDEEYCTDEDVKGAYPWSFAQGDRGVYAVQYGYHPVFLSADSLIIGSSSHAGTFPYRTLGFVDGRATGGITIKASGDVSSSALTNGTYNVFFRLIDKSVYPYVYSPPMCLTEVTTSASYPKIGIDFDNIFGTYMLESWTRATHIEIYRTVTGGTTLFKEVDAPISTIFRTRSGTYFFLPGAIASEPTTNYGLGANNNLLLQAEPLATNDFYKYPAPAGHHCHLAQGVLFVAGTASATGNIEENNPITSDNVVYFSRTDKEEYENFPLANFKIIGPTGSQFMGFVDAGPLTLFLTKDAFVSVQRVGTYLLFQDEGTEGYGCPHEEAYCNIGTAAAWVGEEHVWVHQGIPNSPPQDIGKPIADWIRSLADYDKIRMGYDSRNRQLWITAYDTTSHVYEARIYNLDTQCWVEREDIFVDCFAASRGVESSGSSRQLYGFSGPNIFRMVDYDDRPLVHGYVENNDFDPAHYTMTAAVGVTDAGAGKTTLTGRTFKTADLLIGSVIRFLSSAGVELGERVITDNSTSSVTFGAITLAATDVFIINPIPFRLRFPPIRGQDVFLSKTCLGMMGLFDEVTYLSGESGASLAVQFLADYADTPTTGQSSTITIAQPGTTTQDEDFRADIRATGHVVELELSQLDRYVEFGIIYAGVPVRSNGTLSVDQSTTV